MSAVEAAALLSHAGLDAQLAPVQDLIGRAEGWPVALELAMTTCPPGTEPVPGWGRLSGADHVVSDYFRTEILAGSRRRPGAS